MSSHSVLSLPPSHRHTDRQTDRQTDIHTDRQTDTDIWVLPVMSYHSVLSLPPSHRHTDRQTDRQTHRQTDRHTYRQTDRQTDRYVSVDRQRDNRSVCLEIVPDWDIHRDTQTNGHTMPLVTNTALAAATLLCVKISQVKIYTIKFISN